MLYNIDHIIKQVEDKYILPNQDKRPTLSVILSCSPSASEMSYLKAIYNGASKYNVDLREIRTCEPMQIADDVIDYKVDGVIRISDYGPASNEYIDTRIGCNFDLDGMCVVNQGQWLNDESNLRVFPCTSLACYLILLDYFDNNLKSKDIAVINRSAVVGKPLSLLLPSRRENCGNATVDMIHSYTANIESRVKNRDAIVTATGLPNFFTYSDLKSSSSQLPLVIDVGTGVDKTGKIHGDVIDDIVADPRINVVKSVGKLTTTILFAKLFGGFKCVTWP